MTSNRKLIKNIIYNFLANFISFFYSVIKTDIVFIIFFSLPFFIMDLIGLWPMSWWQILWGLWFIIAWRMLGAITLFFIILYKVYKHGKEMN